VPDFIPRVVAGVLTP